MEQQKKYNQVGITGDDNNYPILNCSYPEGFHCVVAIPVKEYLAINKHFDDIDEEMTELEDKLKPSLFEWLLVD